MAYVINGNYTNFVDTANGTEIQVDLQAGANAFNAHEAATAEHGALGAVVGTHNIQTLTNKILTNPDINGGTIDGTVIGGAVAAAGTFTTLRSSGLSIVPILIPGQVQNLSFTKAAGVITIASASGAALSATNPAWVSVPSAVTGGIHVVLPITANITFNDDDHAASHLAGWTFGVTTGVAWNTELPIFIYVLNKDDTAAGLVFGISRNPTATLFVTNDIGDKDAVPLTLRQGNIFVAASIVEVDYNNVPAQIVGATFMTKVAAADDWTLSTTSAREGFGELTINYATSISYTMPTGQNGAMAAKHFNTVDGSTDLAFDNNNYIYNLNRDGYINAYYNFNTNAVNGADATALRISVPLYGFSTSTNFMISSGNGWIRVASTIYKQAPFLENAGTYFGVVRDSANAVMVDSGFSNGGDYVYGNITYKAF